MGTLLAKQSLSSGRIRQISGEFFSRSRQCNYDCLQSTPEFPDPQDVHTVGVSTSAGYTGQWRVCHDERCGDTEWRQDLFQGALFEDLIGTSCIGRSRAGFLDVCDVFRAEEAGGSISHLEISASNRADTAEECGDGNGQVFVGSSDLELMFDNEPGSGGFCTDNQIVGIRFRGVDISNGAAGTVVSRAHVQFVVDEVDAASRLPVQLRVEGERTVDAEAFDPSRRSDISLRARTGQRVSWSPDMSSQVGSVIQTVDVSHIVQEIVTQPGWASGNAIVIIISHEGGTGNRWVRADTATLVLDYTEPHFGSYPGCWCPEEVAELRATPTKD